MWSGVYILSSDRFIRQGLPFLTRPLALSFYTYLPLTYVLISEGKQYDGSNLKKLRQEFNKFLRVCRKALLLHTTELNGQQKEYHDNLQNGFEKFETSVVTLLKQSRGSTASSTDSKLRRHSTARHSAASATLQVSDNGEADASEV